ncbi:MAG: methylated-DNA--[protein]-cysteine S-methyltransferase [Oligosphaeraceae bacterium]
MDTLLYSSPLGTLLLAGDDHALAELRVLDTPSPPPDEPPRPIPAPLRETVRWLDLYFQGRKPDFLPPLRPAGTPFQRKVWNHLLALPYGTTKTYGELARELARDEGLPRMSPQAVGAALARNPILLLIPCHRVLGAKGKLTGYAAGLPRKQFLLSLETENSSLV